MRLSISERMARTLKLAHRDAASVPAKPNRFGRAYGRRQPGVMNKVETRYSQHLETRKIAKEVEWFAYEAMTFKIGHDVRYTPDFVVMLTDGTIEAHEVKGVKRDKVTQEETFFSMDDAKLKIRVAAAKFPMFRFAIAFPGRDGWVEVEQ